MGFGNCGEAFRPGEQQDQKLEVRKMHKKLCNVARIQSLWTNGRHGAAGVHVENIDCGHLTESLECWLEGFIFIVLIPQRYPEAAPKILLILERELQTA